MVEKKAVFNLTKEEAQFEPNSVMGDMKGINFTFMSDMAKIAEVLPPPLEPAFPLVSGYIVYIDKPSFADPYREAMLGVMEQKWQLSREENGLACQRKCASVKIVFELNGMET